MPKKRAAQLTAKEKEQYFIKLYVEQGATEDTIAYCERRAQLKPGAGAQILKKKSAQQEIRIQSEPVRLEQIKQSMITEAVATAKIAQQEELKNHVIAVQREKIDLEVLDHVLMTMVLGLDMHMHPKEKLDALKAAYVVFGTLESGNTRRLIPPEHLQENTGQGTYTSLFNRLALKSSPESSQPPQTASQDVFDLIPGVQQPESVYAPPLPPSGEPIHEPTPKRASNPNVITVEVG